MYKTDVIIIGAGASGLMCAMEAAQRGRKVMVLDHAKNPGTKILMAGGGKCNFTNYSITPQNYISRNPHFCKSALKQYTQWDFLALMERYKIPFEERAHGQLFCRNSAKEILDMLLTECRKGDVQFQMNCSINTVSNNNTPHKTEKSRSTPEKSSSTLESRHPLFAISTNKNIFHATSLVIATGGLSIPAAGATPLGYRIAEQFNINVWPPRPGLVPFTLQPCDKAILSQLSGIAVEATVKTSTHTFRENILFTHRGLSGPAVLQISSHWSPGETIIIDLLPDLNLHEFLIKRQQLSPNKKLKSVLTELLPKRLINAVIQEEHAEQPLQQISRKKFRLITEMVKQWRIKPGGTEGYRTAEVTLGGVDCNEIHSRTMESRKVKGLYFIGEVLDVTGWLGGYNLQWAWSSGWCAGQVT